MASPAWQLAIQHSLSQKPFAARRLTRWGGVARCITGADQRCRCCATFFSGRVTATSMPHDSRAYAMILRRPWIAARLHRARSGFAELHGGPMDQPMEIFYDHEPTNLISII